MKVQSTEKKDEVPRAQPDASFRQVLRALPPPKPPLHSAVGLRCQRGPAFAAGLPRAALHSRPGSSEGLGLVRHGMHAEAKRLGEVRAELSGRSEQRQEQRALELISRELVREPSRELPPPALPGAPPDPALAEQRGRAEPGEPKVGAAAGPRGEAPQPEPGAELRAEAAMALIERIELFVRSGRPALALSVGGALAATVELERTGPREVALRIQGRRGPPAPEDLAQLRTALEARGLQLRSLQAC